jgi:flagellar biosynthesis anti-sigma factor FlgM
MKKPKTEGLETGVPPGNHKGNNQPQSCCSPLRSGPPDLQKDDKLIEQIRQIIAATPEVRPEKVEPLREAVESGTYDIDPRNLANCLITKVILES